MSRGYLRWISSVIIFREVDGRPWEVFLLRRRRQQDFMGMAFVFPGGRLKGEDCAPELIPYISCSSINPALLMHEPELSSDKAHGLFVAAIRETFEEAGILLVCHSSGDISRMSDKRLISRISSYRLSLQEKKITLLNLVKRANLLLDFHLLTPYAHWITPEIETRRFNTRFFLARAPVGQAPSHDSRELTASCWITPQAALENHDAGEITLMPPTMKMLEELSAFSTIEKLS